MSCQDGAPVDGTGPKSCAPHPRIVALSVRSTTYKDSAGQNAVTCPTEPRTLFLTAGPDDRGLLFQWTENRRLGSARITEAQRLQAGWAKYWVFVDENRRFFEPSKFSVMHAKS